MFEQLELVVKMQDDLGSIGIKKNLPFTNFLNHELNKLRGAGVLQNIFAIPYQNCPLDDNPMPITFSKMIFVFTAFVLGGTLSIIIFMFERAVSNKKDSALKKIDGKDGNTVKGKIPTTNEIGLQCNIGQSVAIGTKNITIY